MGKKLLAWHLGTIATDYIDRLRACPACDHRLTRKSANYRSHSTMNGGWALHDLTLSCGGCGWTHTVRDALEHASPPPKRPPKPGSAPLGPRRGWQIGLRATQPGMPVPLGMVTSPVRVVFATVWAGGGEDTEVEPDPSLPDRGRMAVALSRLLIDRAVRVELPDVEDPEALRLAAVRQELLGGSVLELVEG